MATSLADLLAQEKSAVARFVSVLQDEKTALAQGNAELLASVNGKKVELLELLAAIEGQRSSLVEPECGKGQVGMKLWLTRHPEDKLSRKLWPEVIALAREARHLHDVNGELISLQMGKTQEALAILTQRQKEFSLYGSDGHTESSGPSRIIESA